MIGSVDVNVHVLASGRTEQGIEDEARRHYARLLSEDPVEAAEAWRTRAEQVALWEGRESSVCLTCCPAHPSGVLSLCGMFDTGDLLAAHGLAAFARYAEFELITGSGRAD